MLEIIYIIITLGLTIFVHEFGHFVVAKRLGIKVESFSIGWGPKIFGFKRNETEYIISLLVFLGGYVKLAGELPEEAEKVGEGAFLNQPAYKKIAVGCAGVVQNYLLAIILMWIVFISGIPNLKPVVGELKKGYPAETSGLKKGDEIIEVNGNKIKYWDELTDAITKSTGAPLLITIKRTGKTMNFKITPKIEEVEDVIKDKKDRAFIGIMPSEQDVIVEKIGIIDAGNRAIQQTWFFTVLTVKGVYKMITRKIAPDIAGPIGVAQITWKVAKTGILNLLMLIAIININLALFNLLPIIPFDGGLVFIFLIEFITKKRMSLKVQEALAQFGWALIITLIIFVTYNDIMRIIKGG